MKQFLILAIIVFSVTACKEKTASHLSSENKDTADNAIEKSLVKPSEQSELKVFSPEKMSEFLAEKDNDTLYITNFFATWCGPCIKEIPHFQEKMNELSNQPVKFTFVSIDEKEDWNNKVKDFAIENNLTKNVVLLDVSALSPEFFKKNFKTYSGDAIPFTFFRKKEKTEEYLSMMTKEELDQKIKVFK